MVTWLKSVDHVQTNWQLLPIVTASSLPGLVTEACRSISVSALIAASAITFDDLERPFTVF